MCASHTAHTVLEGGFENSAETMGVHLIALRSLRMEYIYTLEWSGRFVKEMSA